MTTQEIIAKYNTLQLTRTLASARDFDGSQEITPPTFKSDNRLPFAIDNIGTAEKPIQRVIIDTTAAQARRMSNKLAALAAQPTNRVYPTITVHNPKPEIDQTVYLPALGHRIADAGVRFSRDAEGNSSDNNFIGKSISEAKRGNYGELGRISPESLLFGFWDSRGDDGNKNVRLARLISSTILAFDVKVVSSATQFTPALEYDADFINEVNEKGRPAKEEQRKNPAAQYGLSPQPVSPNPSAVFLGPEGKIVQTIQLNLAGLRRLVVRNGSIDQAQTARLQEYLFSLALYVVQADNDDFFLRQGCSLVIAAEEAKLIGTWVKDTVPYAMPTPTQIGEQLAASAAAWFGEEPPCHALTFDPSVLFDSIAAEKQPSSEKHDDQKNKGANAKGAKAKGKTEDSTEELPNMGQ